MIDAADVEIKSWRERADAFVVLGLCVTYGVSSVCAGFVYCNLPFLLGLILVVMCNHLHPASSFVAQVENGS